MIREVRLEQVLEMIHRLHAFATSSLDKPRLSLDPAPSSEEQAQNVLELVPRVLPIDEVLPADRCVKVSGIATRAVEPPVSSLTDVMSPRN